MKNLLKTYVAISVSLLSLTACGAQDIKQAVNLDAPKTNSNNDNSQNNSGSGTQNNVSNSGSGNQTVNTGSGNQSTTNNTNTGSGSQTNNTNTGSGSQTNASNTNTGSGTIIAPVNTGSGGQTTNVNTGSGNQTNIAGDQNNTTNNITINITAPTGVKVEPLDPDNQAKGAVVKWAASTNATSYTIYSDGKILAETNVTKLEIKPENVVQQTINWEKITIVASNGTQTSEPSAFATVSDISIVESTFFNGQVFNDNGSSLSGVQINAKSLNSSVAYEATTTTDSNGKYQFALAPAGVQIEITASKSGYATRRRVEVLKSNKQNDPDGNRYDFSSNYALSNQPEVSSVSPGRNATGVRPDTDFVLKFSTPMDTESVESNFGIYAADSTEFTVGTSISGGTPNDPASGDLIWDSSAFNISWNNDNTEVIFSFNQERKLPTDIGFSQSIYLISLGVGDGIIKSESGGQRSEGYFKLSNTSENGSKFYVDVDENKPGVHNINAITGENGNSEGDEVEVKFSEPMVFYTEDPGMIADQYLNSAAQYFISINGGTEVPWSNYGSVVVSTDDPTHKTILLRLSNPNTNVFQIADRVSVRVEGVRDPAGNTIDASNNSEDDVAS